MLYYPILKFLGFVVGYKVKTGYLTLSPSSPDFIKIYTGFTPKKVSLTFFNDIKPFSCLGNIDSFDVRVVPQGFVLKARIRGRSRRVRWIATGF